MWYYISSLVSIYGMCRGCLVFMEENRKDTLQSESKENNKTASGQATRHTWIGDPDEIRPQPMNRTVTRMTQTLDTFDDRSTRVVEKQRKEYKGFITDDEIKSAEAQAEADRKAREAEKAARETSMSQTRIYTGFGSGMEDTQEEKKKPARKFKPVKKTYVFSIADDRKFRRLRILAAVFVLILAFEICFAVMQYKSTDLPDKTAQLKDQTATLLEENKELKTEEENLGNYEEIKELRDSWERLKEQLEE